METKVDLSECCNAPIVIAAAHASWFYVSGLDDDEEESLERGYDVGNGSEFNLKSDVTVHCQFCASCREEIGKPWIES